MLQFEIADCFTRVRNAYAVNKPQTSIRKTKFNAAVLEVLKEQGSIKDVVDGDSPYELNVVLAYRDRRPSLKSIKVASRPGLRRYYKCSAIPRFKSGLAYGVMLSLIHI